RDGRHLNRSGNYRLGRLMLSKLLEMDEMSNVGVNSSVKSRNPEPLSLVLMQSSIPSSHSGNE
ncbi:hypothetical protein J6590_066331, partial [Homalodisca vitripennis]